MCTLNDVDDVALIKQMSYTNSSCIRTLHTHTHTHYHAQCRDLVVTQSGDDAKGEYCKYIRRVRNRDKTVLQILSLRGVRCYEYGCTCISY